VNWDKDVILFVQANDAHPDTEVHLKSLSRDGGTATVTAEMRSGPPGTTTLGVVVRPWVIASAPAAAFAEDAKVRFTIDGRETPVRHAR
jgi:hypothetical protein